MPSDDARPPCTGAAKLELVLEVVVVPLVLPGSCVVVGVSGGGVLAADVVVEVEAILLFEMFKILTILDSGLIDG